MQFKKSNVHRYEDVKKLMIKEGLYLFKMNYNIISYRKYVQN